MMMSLCDKIKTHNCSSHGNAYSFLCVEKDCKHKLRMMCEQCLIPNQTQGLINIQSAFQQIDDQQKEYTDQFYESVAQLRQDYGNKRNKIIELLDKMEKQMEQYINIMCCDRTMDSIRQGYCNRELQRNDICNLGTILIGRIIVDNNGKYLYPQLQTQKSEYKNTTAEILSALNSVDRELQGYLKSLTDQIKLKQQQKVVKTDYQPSQTIQLTAMTLEYLCLNHNQTQLAAAVENTILLFNLKHNECIQDRQQLDGHKEIVWQVKFNHNSTQLASCSNDKSIIIWNKQQDGNWRIQNKLTRHTDQVWSICFNHDSTILASGSNDKTIQIHVKINGNWEMKEQLTEHTLQVYDVCFNNDSTQLASASNDKLIIIWQRNNVGKWIVKQKLNEHTEAVVKIAFNFQSTQLVSGSRDNSIKVWSVDNENIWKCNHTLTEHTSTVKSVCFNQQSNMIISSGFDTRIRVWKFNDGNYWECAQTIQKHTKWVQSSIISNDSSMIISGAADKTIKIHQQNYKGEHIQTKQLTYEDKQCSVM